MLNLKYAGENISYIVKFKLLSSNVVQITGSFPVKEKGFVCYRDEDLDDIWDYTDYKTVYKTFDEGAQFSNDGSVYVAPPEPTPIPNPEPYIPTLEEVKAAKKQEIYTAYNADVAAGVDVELSTGTEHFPLTQEDREFLFGKQVELSGSNAETVSYQNSSSHCILLSREDMQKIITAAFAYVNFKTTYRNNLYEWVDGCGTTEDVRRIVYGMDIPEEHQSVAFKMYLAQQQEG